MFRREERRHEEEMMMVHRRRRRRRLMVGGMVVIGSTEAMMKMSEADAQKIQETTGKAPEDMSHDELTQAAAQAGVQPQEATPEDQQAMANAEAADPDQS